MSCDGWLNVRAVLTPYSGDDENVPVWHTRVLVDTLKAWNPTANVTYVFGRFTVSIFSNSHSFREDPGQPHCYDAAFGDGRTQAFIDASLNATFATQGTRSFTLTVAIPAESGPLHGFRVLRLWTPGRYASCCLPRRCR